MRPFLADTRRKQKQEAAEQFRQHNGFNKLEGSFPLHCLACALNFERIEKKGLSKKLYDIHAATNAEGKAMNHSLGIGHNTKISCCQM